MLKSFLLFLAGLEIAFITSVATAAEVISFQPPISNHTRILAASCAACHGTNGNSTGIIPSLAGIDGAYFVTQMLAFKNGERSATVMQQHAKGLNIDEINLLALYFSQQKHVAGISPKPQQLKAEHE